MHAALLETMSSNALLVRQRSHLSASSSGREHSEMLSAEVTVGLPGLAVNNKTGKTVASA